MFFAETIAEHRRKRAAEIAREEKRISELKRKIDLSEAIYNKVHEIEDMGFRLRDFFTNFELSIYERCSFYYKFDLTDKLRVRIVSEYNPEIAKKCFGRENKPVIMASFVFNGYVITNGNKKILVDGKDE